MAKVCKFQKEKEVVSYDCGETWSPTGESRKIQGQAPVEKPSMDCGWTGIFTYRWDVDESGYICNGYDKYSKLVQYYSYDQGETWDKVDGSDQIGTLLERFSADCCYLRNISGESFCTCELQKVNGSLVEASLDNQNWIYTGKYVVDEVVDDFPVDCFEMGGWCTVIQHSDGHNSIWDCGDIELLCNHDDQYDYFGVDDVTKIWYNCTESLSFHGDGSSPIMFYKTLEKIYFTENFSSTAINGDYGQCSGLTDVIGLENTSIERIAADFSLCTSLSGLTLPASCRVIGGAGYTDTSSRNFAYCTSLKYINLENCTGAISSACFKGCTGLTGVTLPTSTSYGTHVFENCTSLEEVEISHVTDYMFDGCTSLTSATINNSTNIGYATFMDCTSLKNITFNGGVAWIGYTPIEKGFCFVNCSSLESITIPARPSNFQGLYLGYGGNSTINPIPTGMFSGCTSLSSMTFLDIVPAEFGGMITSDGQDHYQDYRHMFDDPNNCPIYVPPQSVDIYKSAYGWELFSDRIQAIEDYDPDLEWKARLSYSGDVVYEIPNTLRAGDLISDDIKNSEYSGYTLISVEINGKTVQRIGSGTFEYCYSLSSVTIPSGVTYLGAAFISCSGLTSIELPSTIDLIAMDAFYRCDNLSGLTIHATTPPTLEYHPAHGTSFANDCPIYVPAESVELYKTTGNWVLYADRIQAIS